jgi:hypothetical protein
LFYAGALQPLAPWLSAGLHERLCQPERYFGIEVSYDESVTHIACTTFCTTVPGFMCHVVPFPVSFLGINFFLLMLFLGFWPGRRLTCILFYLPAASAIITGQFQYYVRFCAPRYTGMNLIKS